MGVGLLHGEGLTSYVVMMIYGVGYSIKYYVILNTTGIPPRPSLAAEDIQRILFQSRQ